MFPSCLEYSPTSDGAYCLPCYLFGNKPSGHLGSDVFTRQGFRAWRKVNAGKNCAFLNHIGDGPCSPHNNAMKACEDLLNQSKHIKSIINVQSLDQVCKNRLRLKTSIDTIRWLTFQACAFRGDTHWSSHFHSICCMIKMYNPTCLVLQKIIIDGSTYSQRGDADAAYNMLYSFEFILILHMTKEIMGITDCLCQTLQQQSQDILNAMQLVRSTKMLIQKLRDDGWQDLLKVVILFCEQHEINIPDLNSTYVAHHSHSRHQKDHVTIEHHFRVNIFFVIVDKQLQELNDRFSEQTVELLTLSSTLVPKDCYKAFNIEDICTFVNKFYPSDFNEQEKISLKFHLQHFIIDAPNHPDLKNLSTMLELCQSLTSTKKSNTFYLIDQLIRLILTLPVSTTTTEISFSAMKIIKTRLRSKMKDEFLAVNMIIYIEKEIAENFSSESIIDEFKNLKERRAIL